MKWYKIDVTTTKNYKPPFFCGSMLRGAFGVALKRVVCINPSYSCDGCFAKDSCLYYSFYEQKNSFHKYRITSKLGMENLKFSIYLFEDSTDELPYVLSAIKKALEEIGLGREKEPVKISEISVNEKPIYRGEDFLPINGITPNEFELDEIHSNIKIEFKMPLRIKQNNQFAKNNISLPHLIINIHNRYRELKELSYKKLGFKVEGEIVKSNLRYLDLYRYSNRQRSKMKLGGIIGDITIKGVDAKSFYYLKLGEVIGAGKQTVFGLGDYEITPLGEE
jgi:hypothetical protein